MNTLFSNNISKGSGRDVLTAGLQGYLSNTAEVVVAVVVAVAAADTWTTLPQVGACYMTMQVSREEPRAWASLGPGSPCLAAAGKAHYSAWGWHALSPVEAGHAVNAVPAVPW